MNRLFEDSFIRPSLWPLPFEDNGRVLPVDVIETKDDFQIKASVPGFRPEDIDVSVMGETLTIKGEMKEEEKHEEGNYLRKERHFGSFQRTLSLPASVVPDKAKAEFENGVLTLTLPKADQVKPKSIKVSIKK